MTNFPRVTVMCLCWVGAILLERAVLWKHHRFCPGSVTPHPVSELPISTAGASCFLSTGKYCVHNADVLTGAFACAAVAGFGN